MCINDYTQKRIMEFDECTSIASLGPKFTYMLPARASFAHHCQCTNPICMNVPFPTFKK